MAQKGRGGPRTRFQRWCPGAMPPYWAWKYLRLEGSFNLDAFGHGIPVTSSTWGEVTEVPADGMLHWNGSAVWDGAAMDWELIQVLVPNAPGVAVAFLGTQGAGYYYSEWYFPLGLTWDPPNFGDLGDGDLVLYDAPFGPFGTPQVKGRQWHEM